MEISNSRAFAAEVVGTTVLMLGGPGSAILAGDRIGTLGIAFAFGFSLLIMAYALGHVTGANINPAVTLGLVLTRKLTWGKAVFFWVGQFVGAALGGLIIFAIANNIDGFSSKNNFAAERLGPVQPRRLRDRRRDVRRGRVHRAPRVRRALDDGLPVPRRVRRDRRRAHAWPSSTW